MGVRMHILNQVTLLVRRHETNMTLGRDCYEMNVIGVLRNSLGRRRLHTDGVAEPLIRPLISPFDDPGRIVLIRDRASRAPCCGPLADRGAIYFDRVRDAFERAARAVASVREHSIAIGGRSLTLSFAGEALPGRIWPALAHLRSAPSQSCDLRIMLWDSVSTGVALPEPPWGGGDHVARGDVIGFNNERIRTAFVRDPDLLSLFDAEKRMAIFWTRDCRGTPVLGKRQPAQGHSELVGQ